MLYALYELFGADGSVFDFIGFGFYITLIASILGVVFSKDD